MIKFNESGDILTKNYENANVDEAEREAKQIKYILIERDDNLELIKLTEPIAKDMHDTFESISKHGFTGLYMVADDRLKAINGMAYILAGIVKSYGDKF